jgi:hypothetical protein
MVPNFSPFPQKVAKKKKKERKNITWKFVKAQNQPLVETQSI